MRKDREELLCGRARNIEKIEGSLRLEEVTAMFFRRTTSFLFAGLMGLIAVSPFGENTVQDQSAIRIWLSPPLSRVIPNGEIVGKRNCGLLVLKLDDAGRIKLNNESLGKITDLEELRERIDQIVRERGEAGVFIRLDPSQAEFFGAETVKAEFVIDAPASARYADLIKLVDFAASFEPSTVMLEIDS